ncbi:MAG: PPOX class F420-dependent oxidoreductase [Acidimicrobiia bacterium]
MSEPALNAAAKALLAEPVIANLATVGRDGSPHLTPVWVDLAGDDVVINTAEGRAKIDNLRRQAKVAVSVVDPQDPYRVLALQGAVTAITDHDADAHIDRLARKYLGVDTYPMRQPGERRLKVTIRPDRVLMQPADR